MGSGRIICLWILAVLMLPAGLLANSDAIYLLNESHLEADADGLPTGWKPLTFSKIPRHTSYRVERVGNRYAVKAESDASASGIYREVNIDPKEYPGIAWRWKIDNLIEKADATKKDGDDYPARLYITFKYDPDQAGFMERAQYGIYKLLFGRYPPKAAINYIWDNRLPKETIISNAYTDKAKMIVVESGPSLVGQWVREERNLYEDYQKAFGSKPPPIIGVAIMTDTDNTREAATAHYGEIVFKATQP
jgi:Protein of unknown function (DUF3047)